MQSQAPNRIQIRDYPIILWFFGGIFIVIGIWMLINQQSAWVSTLFFLIGSLLILVLGSITTITVDKEAGTLEIRNRSILRNVVKEYTLNEVTAVDVEQSRDSDGSTYRVAIRTTSGESIPFHSYYTSGVASKERQAKKLRDFLALPDPTDASSHSTIKAIIQDFQLLREGITQEVAWRLEHGGFGTAEITRWISTAAQMPSGFLLLVQKPKNSPLFSSSKLFNPISRSLYEQMLKIYGFSPENTPGLDQAAPLEPPEPRLDPHYATLTSDPISARQILNPWFVIPLVHWAEAHPINEIQPDGDVGQLAVLFSSRGVTLAWIGEPTLELTEELIHLGVELVKTHGG
jgi:hypothetical protein